MNAITIHRKQYVTPAVICFLYVVFVIQYGIKNLNSTYYDFPSFYAAAKVTFHKKQSPYPLETLLPYQSEISDPNIYPYLYPPPSLFLFYHLTLLTYPQAKILTHAINHMLAAIIFIVLLQILRKRLLLTGLVPLLLFSVYFLNFDPVINTIELGQVNLMILLCMTGIWYLISKPEPIKDSAILIGLLLSVAVLLKVYPALLLIFFFFRKEYRVVISFCSWSGFFALLAYFSLPEILWKDWTLHMLMIFGYGNPSIPLVSIGLPWNISLSAFFSRLFESNNWTTSFFNIPWLAPVFTYLVSALMLILQIRLTLRIRYVKEKHNLINLEFGLYLLSMFIINSHSWGHHLAFLLPSLIIAGYYLATTHTRKLTEVVVVLSLIILALKIPYWNKILFGPTLNWMISIKLYAILCLWYFVYQKLWRSVHETKAEKMPSHSHSPMVIMEPA